MKIRNLTFSIVLFILLPLTTAIAADDALWQALREGGNVLLMRHAPTEKTSDPLLFEPDNCIQERDLSVEGKALVLDIGHALRKNRIPIGTVYSSRYCRAINTAWMTYDKVELWAPLDLLHGLSEAEATAHTEMVAERIANYKGKKNMVMVTHRPNINQLTLELPPYAGIVVLKPTGDGDFEIIGTLTPKDVLGKPARQTK